MPLIKSTKIYWFLFLVILMICSYLRLQSSFSGTFAYTYDIGRDMLNIASIVYGHHITLIGPTTGQEGIFYGPWWYWLLSPFFVLFAGSVKGIDAVMGLTGVITVLLAYWVGYKVAGKWNGLLFMVLFGIAGSLIDTSSQIWNPNIAPFILMCIITVFIKYSEEKKEFKKILWMLVVGILSTITLDSLEIVYGTVQFIAVVIFMLFYFRNKLNLFQIWSFILGILIIELPRFLFEIRHQFIMSKALFNYIFHHAPVSQQGGIFEQFVKVLNLMMQLWQSTISLPLIWAIVVFIITVLSLLYFKNKTKFHKVENLLYVFSVCYLFCYFVILSFFKGNVWDHFVVGIPVVYEILFSLFIYKLFLHLKKTNNNYAKLFVALMIIYVLEVLFSYRPTKTDFFINDPSIYNNQVAVIKYIYSQAGGRHFNYDVYTPPIHPYTYEYLFNFYSKKYYPPSNDGHLLFYIIEQDKNHPTLRQNWLTLHDKRGKVIKTITLPGHIIVQTRNI